MVGRQWVGYSAAPDPNATDRMDHVAFTTNNIVALRNLIANGLKVPAIENQRRPYYERHRNRSEGHRIEFVERGKAEVPAVPDSAFPAT